MTVGKGPSPALARLERWANQHQNSDDETKSLAASATRLSVDLYRYGEEIERAVAKEERAELEWNRAEAKAYASTEARLKLQAPEGKKLSETAIVERTKRLVNDDQDVIDARVAYLTAKAYRRRVEIEIRALEKLSDNAKFAARASSGEMRDVGL